MSSVKLVNITKEFDRKTVLDNINLEVKEGEIISLLGKSGCGKSTTLQIIAGLIKPDKGDIIFNNESVLNLQTNKRDAVIVFQDYLLFPHMNVFQNVEFGLKMRKVDKNTSKEKVSKLLNLVKLSGYENKYPSELSGGQKQRVAIARTLAVNPKVLLLDEPFSNLDINLRNEMREFILDIQRELKITTILVTHDKEEALMMSDRIAVMVSGEIKQLDKPNVLYEEPICRDVADIFGERNYIKGKVVNSKFVSDSLEMGIKEGSDIDINEQAVLAMIPIESITIKSIQSTLKDTFIHYKRLEGSIVSKRYAGGKTYYKVKSTNSLIKAISSNNDYEIGQEINMFIEEDKVRFFKNT